MPALYFTLIQSKLHWEDPVANLELFTQKIASIKDKKAVVILPEMFSTGFSMRPEALAEKMDGQTVQWMRETAKAHRIILTGSVMIEAGGKYYNRMIWMLPDGSCGHYDKRHLFAYAGEDAHFTAGKERLIASVNGWKVLVQVCYDLRFPVWARQQFNDEGFEYDVLLYVANWPQRRATAWKTLLQARAIENQCYVIGVNRVGEDGNGHHYSGDSMVIDPLGAILYHKEEAEDIHTIALDKEHLDGIREKLPFWKDADDFGLLL